MRLLLCDGSPLLKPRAWYLSCAATADIEGLVLSLDLIDVLLFKHMQERQVESADD